MGLFSKEKINSENEKNKSLGVSKEEADKLLNSFLQKMTHHSTNLNNFSTNVISHVTYVDNLIADYWSLKNHKNEENNNIHPILANLEKINQEKKILEASLAEIQSRLIVKNPFRLLFFRISGKYKKHIIECQEMQESLHALNELHETSLVELNEHVALRFKELKDSIQLTKDHASELQKTSLEFIEKDLNSLFALYKQEIDNQSNSIFRLTNSLNTHVLKLGLFKKVTDPQIVQDKIFEEAMLNFDNAVLKFQDFTIYDDLPNVKRIIDILASIKDIITEIYLNIEIKKRTSIAVGGGFSAGKSEFLNTLLNLGDLLPTDISWTTSVPTYILHDENESKVAYTKRGSIISLTNEEFQRFKHGEDENDSTKFIDFSNLIEYLAVSHNMSVYSNLVFFDTPGYSKKDEAYLEMESDAVKARRQINLADGFFWVFDVDNGTIRKSDLDFIKSLDNSNKPKYIICNKADKKTKNDIIRIVDEVAITLDQQGIKYAGITAFSSRYDVKTRQVVVRHKSIQDFLDGLSMQSKNNNITIRNDIYLKLNSIEADYKKHFQKKNQECNEIIKSLNEVASIIISDENTDKLLQVVKEKKRQKNDIAENERRFFTVMDALNRSVEALLSQVLKLPTLPAYDNDDVKNRSTENFENNKLNDFWKNN